MSLCGLLQLRFPRANYEYDNEGNRTKRTRISDGEVTEYSWDYRNRLTQVVTRNAGGTVTRSVNYAYDVWDDRISKTVDADGAGPAVATTERFVYDRDQIALVFDGSGTQTRRYLYGTEVDQVLAEERSATDVLWALTDHQGTVRDVINNAGVVQNHIRYDSFGNVVSQTNPNLGFRFGYTGRDVDSETGLNYYRARYFDPATGRFLSEDPLGFDAGDANLYRYVFNSQTNFTDPSGMVFDPTFGNDSLYNALNAADQFAAGFADSLTFSTSTQIREAMYGDIARRNHQGGAFTAGQLTGAGASFALGFGAPTRLIGGLSWAQRVAQGYTVASTGIGAYSSTRNIIEGCANWTDYLAFAPVIGYGGALGSRYLRGLGGVDDFARRLGRGQPVILDLFGGASSQIPNAINVDLLAQQGSRIRSPISDLNRLLPPGYVDEIVASGPQAEFLETAANLLKPGGRIYINATRRNRFGRLPSDDALSSLGLRVVQKNGDLDTQFSQQVFRRTDGTLMPTSSFRTTILERLP